MKNLLINELKKNDIPCTEEQAEVLIQYMERLLEINGSINMTSITDPEEFIYKHYVDSALVMKLPEFKKGKKVLDLGTGGGFPGVPLAVLNPNKKFMLMDSLNKRIKAISEICSELGITNAEFIHGRAEELGQNPLYREKYDICVSRAVARMSVLNEYCIPFVRKGGSFIAYKSRKYQEELETGTKSISVLGGKLENIYHFEIRDLEHNLVVISKKNFTPKKFPRKAGTPAKTPIE